MADPYATLGVPRGADEAAIKKAYRKLAKELHPDKNKDNPKATERFSKVAQAYDLLSDKDKRARFDRGEIDGDGNPAAPFGYGGGGPGGPQGGFRPSDFGNDGAEFGDIFEGLFGGNQRRSAPGGFAGGFGRRPAAKGANVAYRLSVGFEDAARLSPQRITLQGGKTIDLKLPAGVESGTQMRLSGKGDEGPGGFGDAIITIEIQPHRFYQRSGDDIRLDLPVTLNEAVLGGPVRVPTPDGPVMLTVPKGSTSGKVLRLSARGFHKKGGGRGNLLVTLVVDLPADDSALAAFAEGWRDERNPRAKMGV